MMKTFLALALLSLLFIAAVHCGETDGDDEASASAGDNSPAAIDATDTEVDGDEAKSRVERAAHGGRIDRWLARKTNRRNRILAKKHRKLTKRTHKHKNTQIRADLLRADAEKRQAEFNSLVDKHSQALLDHRAQKKVYKEKRRELKKARKEKKFSKRRTKKAHRRAKKAERISRRRSNRLHKAQVRAQIAEKRVDSIQELTEQKKSAAAAAA